MEQNLVCCDFGLVLKTIQKRMSNVRGERLARACGRRNIKVCSNTEQAGERVLERIEANVSGIRCGRRAFGRSPIQKGRGSRRARRMWILSCNENPAAADL